MSAAQACAFGRAADDACLASHAGTLLEIIHCMLPVDLTWATDTPETLPADTQAYDIVNGTPAVNSLQYVWLLVAFVGSAVADHPLLLIEQSQVAAIGTLLTAAGISTDWAIWGRLVDGRLENYTI